MQQPGTALSRADWRLILLASLGGALEFYDFVIYSQFAQYIGRNFFPNDDPMVSLIVSFGVFAVGYFALVPFHDDLTQVRGDRGASRRTIRRRPSSTCRQSAPPSASRPSPSPPGNGPRAGCNGPSPA